MIQVTKVTNNPPRMITSSSNPLMKIDLSNNPPVKLLMEWGGKKKPPTLYDYNISLCILHSSTYMTTTKWGESDKDIFRPMKLMIPMRE